MSTDLHFRQEVLGIRSCTTVSVKVSLSPPPPPPQPQPANPDHTPTAAAKTQSKVAVAGKVEENCLTPQSPRNMIPKTEGCPPAPKKAAPVRAPTCKRKLSDFFEAVSRDEIQSFFRQVKPNSGTKKRCQLV